MKITHMVLAGAVVIALLFVACVYLGLVPGLEIPGSQTNDSDDVPEGAVLQSFGDRDIFYALQTMFNKTLPYAQIVPYISALDIQMYGINGQSAYDTWQWYQQKNLAGGYTSYTYALDRHSHWTAYHEIWYKDIDGRAVSVGDGASIKTAYGYDTMILTSHGPITTYYNFLALIRSS